MNKEELEQAMDIYQDTIYRIAMNFTQNTADAQDISQEVFLRLYRFDRSFSSEEHRRAWLIRVTINLCKNIVCSKWHKIMQQSPEEIQNLASYDHENLEKRMWVTTAMQHLSKTDRMILHLYYYEEYDTRSIADFMQIKETAVRKRLSRARKRLEKQLGEEVFRYEAFQLDQTISH